MQKIFQKSDISANVKKKSLCFTWSYVLGIEQTLFPCVKNSYSSFKAPRVALGLFPKAEVLERENLFFCDVPILRIFLEYGHYAATYVMSFSPSTLYYLRFGITAFIHIHGNILPSTWETHSTLD